MDEEQEGFMKNKAVKILLGITIAIVICGVGYYKFHPHIFKQIEFQEPTFTEQGIEKYKCWCGSEKTEMLDAIGHDYQTETIDATFFPILHLCCCKKKSRTLNYYLYKGHV
ncbi:hypothetical protein [Butyrivibrio sp. WCD3002]|uniref:hypothetical protein n=1 Tax=Butyrivibrio sp. WCD3002 TaxID=1280676 RepID=UPI001A98F542|nr:hypothetical protein [Butyrivibrio sp. WCD3002]